MTINLTNSNVHFFEFTPKFKVRNADDSYTFTFRAKLDNKTLGFSLSIGSTQIKLKNLEGKEGDVFPILIVSNNTEGDNFLKFLINQWNIEKIGKPRMKKETILYAYNLELANNSLENKIKFLGYFGINQKGQLDPSLAFEINWDEGIARIYETSIFQREVIINRLMV